MHQKGVRAIKNILGLAVVVAATTAAVTVAYRVRRSDLLLYALMARVRDPKGEELEWSRRRARELNLP